jgi:transposase
MIDYDLFCKIKNLHQQDGLKPSQIADKLGIDPRTVAKWINEDKFRQRKSTGRPSKLDPHKDEIIRMLEIHPYTATQIYQRICEHGYQGGYSILKEYIRKIRPKRSPAFLKLSFAPGECGQVDWGSYGSVNVGNTRRRLSFFVMVLCYSRMMYVEFTVSQTMEHFLACHQNAFHFFGAVPSRIMVDNLKSAVIKRIIGQAPVFNPKYLDFANHHGFDIVACNVGKGNEKGIVESGVGYTKKNFLAGWDIHDFSAVNPACRQWLDSVANIRIHGETKKKPTDLFAEEKPHLKPLPLNLYDIATISQARASSQFRVTLDTNRYSVPAEYAGANVTLKTYPDRICIYLQEKLIARHQRSYDRHKDFEDPDHPKELLAQRKKASDQKIVMRFLALSNRAQDYYRELEKRRINSLHHLRKIVALSEIYDIDSVARAMDDAFEFQAFSCEYIANLLEQRNRIVPEPGALHLTRREDLLDISVEPPDMNIYQTRQGDTHE